LRSDPPRGSASGWADVNEQRQPALAADSRARTIVVLDDDPGCRAQVEEILGLEGYRVTSTSDPRAALRIARDESADLVLAEIGMGAIDVVPRWERRRSDPDPIAAVPPISHGYALLRALQVDSSAARYPAVFLRERVMPADRAPAYRFGVAGYVPKPIDRHLLLARIEPLLDTALPAVSSSADPPAALAELQAPGFEALPRGLRTALVVDPDDAQRQRLHGLLQSHGFMVYEAASGGDGVRLSLARRPWMIVTEVNLPELDGFELCRRVRSHALTRHTPLMFHSSLDDYRERYLGLKLGADDYLSKGVSARELLIRIQLVLKRYADVGTRTRHGAGLEGELKLIGATGLLQMCHLSRFSGTATVRRSARKAQFRFRDGEILSAESGKLVGAGAVFDVLAWTDGRFEFVPGDPGEGEPLAEAFDYLLLEGCRRLDEENRPSETA
jgi:DNA-binding response OmpR family regulator